MAGLAGTILAIAIKGVAMSAMAVRGADEVSPPLTNVHQVLAALRSDIPTEPAPVRISGLVTFAFPQRNGGFFLHDGKASVSVLPAQTIAGLRPGQNVEVEGVRRVSETGPFVANASVRILGEGLLPTAETKRFADLINGPSHGAWVEVTGTILDVMLHEGKLWLLLATGESVGNAVVYEAPNELPEELINARVTVRGVSYMIVGPSARPAAVHVLCSSRDSVKIISPASTNRFERPLRTALGLRSRGIESEERVLMRGVVTHAAITGWLVVEDETGPFQVERLAPMPKRNDREWHVTRASEDGPKTGDIVELVVSHVKLRPMAPLVQWADYRVVGTTNLPPPRRINSSALNDADHDGRRVTVRARVLDQSTHLLQNHHFGQLLLQDGAFRFDAVLGTAERVAFPVKPGDLVEITGVATTRAAGAAARVFLSSVSDVRVIAAPPAWVTGPAMKFAVATGGALAVALAWIWALRRRVAARTAELAASNARLKRNEEVLQRALAHEQELHELKANFVSMVSHEFRTPLGVIVSSTDILRRYFDRLEPPMRENQLDIILRSTGTLSSLVEDLLLLGKVEAGKLSFQPTALDLQTFCRHLVDEVQSATQRACPIHLNLHGDFKDARGDEALLRPALTNLLTNAVKYSPQGSPVNWSVTRQNGNARFVIRDHGIGIPEEDQQKLFVAFARAGNVGHRPGTGLGLVIAKRCVELHGGQIEFDSTSGEGTTFSITVPFFAEPQISKNEDHSPH